MLLTFVLCCLYQELHAHEVLFQVCDITHRLNNAYSSQILDFFLRFLFFGKGTEQKYMKYYVDRFHNDVSQVYTSLLTLPCPVKKIDLVFN